MLYSKIYQEDMEKNVSCIKELLQGLSGKHILITGATGLIGSALVDFLSAADKQLNLNICIYAASRNIEKLEQRFGNKSAVSFIVYDALTPLEGNVQYDFIIHCASNAHPKMYGKEPVETMLVNFCGMNHLLEYVKNSGNSCRVMYLSSSEVYGNRKNNVSWYKEDNYYDLDILNVRACYPSSKRATETLCEAYIQEYGLDIVIARPGHVYGPTMTKEDTRASAQFFSDVLADRDIIMKSSGQQLRSYCYVMDCVSALFTILIKGKRGEAYNISNKNSVVTIRQFADIIAKQAGKNMIFENPTKQEMKTYNLMDISALDASKLEALGWQGRYDTEEGVRMTLITLRA